MFWHVTTPQHMRKDKTITILNFCIHYVPHGLFSMLTYVNVKGPNKHISKLKPKNNQMDAEVQEKSKYKHMETQKRRQRYKEKERSSMSLSIMSVIVQCYFVCYYKASSHYTTGFS